MSQALITSALLQDTAPHLDGRQWEQLLGEARRSRLLARLAVRGDRAGWLDRVPQGPRMHLCGALRVVQRKDNEVRWEIDRLRAALVPRNLRVVLLKGAAYHAADLPPRRGRLFSDVDILVARDQLLAVESALMAGGWIPEKLDPYDDRYYRDWMHELPPLRHVSRHTHLDVHHTITPPTSRFPIDGASLLERAVPLGDGSGLYVLEPCDMVLHSAVHLMQEGQFDGGLRDLLDIRDLLMHFSSRDTAFWSALAERAQDLRLSRPLAHVLAQIERLSGLRPPAPQAEVFRAMARGGPGFALMQRLLSRVLTPDSPRASPAMRLGRRLAEGALYVRSHWLRMPWYLIVPHLVRKAWMRAQADRDRKAKQKEEADRRPGP